MQAYFNLYPRDMVGASSVAINHAGDFGVVTMQNTNNLGLLTVSPSPQLGGYSIAALPDSYIKRGTGKSINGFDAALTPDSSQSSWAYSWAYPQEVVFTSDDSRIYIGMAGGLPNANLTKKFGSADALMLHTQMDLPQGAFSGGNPPPGYGLYGGTDTVPLKSPRSAAALQAFDTSRDLLSDQLKAFNRWNSLKTISPEWKAKLVSTDVDHLTVPGKPMANDNIADCLNFGYFLPLSGVGYRVNTFGMPKDRTNFATRGVVTALEQIGLEWNKRYHDYLRGVPAQIPVTRPYFILGLLSQPGGGAVLNQAQEAMDYTPGTGAEANFPYLTIGSDKAHDFVTSNGTRRPNDNSKENTNGFDRKNTEALIRLLLADARVVRIELDPRVVDLIPDLKNEQRVFVHGRLPVPGSKEIPSERRDLDNHMFVTFSSMAVDLDIDSDNNGVFDRSPEEDRIEDLAGSDGKFITPNSGTTKNSIPDYANGFDLTPGRFQPDASAKFTPMVIRFPDGYNLWSSQFRLTYSMSDPGRMMPSASDPTIFELPHEGAYRIWTKDGDEARRKAPIDAGGDFIASNIKYSWLDLMKSARPAGSTRDFAVYIESVEPGLSETDREVVVEFFPNVGPQSSVGALVDSVSVTSAVGALAVDANRDGKITLAGENYSDQTAPNAPFRFWINDDDDSGDVDGKDIPGQPRNGPGEEGADYTTTSPSADVEGNGAIDGTRDFIDFFPVFIDLKQILAALPPNGTVKYKLKQADGAVNFVYTNQTRDHAFDFQRQKLTNGFGATLSQAPEWSQTQRVTRQGVELRGDFLNLIQTGNGGVLLIEGCAPTTAPLVLAVEKDGTTIAEVKLELKIGPVEDMYRRLNLRAGSDAPSSGLSGLRQDDGLPTSMGEPSNFPDATGPDSWLVFVHGYNVSGAAARGWSSEAFKRFYWSHNKARFVGVSWFGNPYGAEEDKVADYHLAVMNAFISAPALAAKINPLTGRKTIVGHSLGCGIVSSAIHDAGLVVNDFCMVDAAMSMEAYKSDTTADVEGMAIPPWVDGEASSTPNYPRGAWASEWHRLFENTPADQRNGVTWRGRLSGVVSVAHNFYSRTEDVLARLPGTPPDGILSILWSQPGMLSGRYAWTVQEKTKGRRMDINVLVGHVRAGSDYGGWGFNLTDPADPTDPVYYWADGSVFGGCKRAQLSSFPDPATSLGRELYKRAPLFDPGYGPETGCMRWYDPTRDLRGPSWLPDLFNEGTGSVTAGDPNKRNQLLAQAFPALTQPAGANYTPAFSAARNHNMPEELLGPAGWPAARGQEVVGGTPMARWLHSDMREVAYLYTHLLFDQIVTISGGTP